MSSVAFTINGKPYRIDGATCSPDTSLNTFLRSHANLQGTKSMCLEGGCGACVVAVRTFLPIERKYKTWTVNSVSWSKDYMVFGAINYRKASIPQCLKPVFSCHDLEITTIEGLGNRKDGYHDLQKRLVRYNGTQCGYCSPGMVMNMFGLLEANEGQVTMEQVENSFGGNICRCTGYRPILDAFKSLAVDAAPCKYTCLSVGDKGNDIEDLPYKCFRSAHTNGTSPLCHNINQVSKYVAFRDDRMWINVRNLAELFHIFDSIDHRKYMLVGGNTAHGVYRRPADVNVFIQVSNLDAECSYDIRDDRVILAANLSLSTTMEILRESAMKPGFGYFAELVQHIDLIANSHVRSV